MSLNGNWIDLVILLVIAFFVFESLRVGFWIILADFASFFLSLLISLRGYQVMARVLRSNFSLSHSVSNALGFLATAVIAELVLGVLFIKLIGFLPEKILKSKASKYLIFLPALGEAFVLIAFLITLVMGLPVSPKIKNDISKSKIGSVILRETSGAEKRLSEIFGGVIEDSLTYFTIRPQSNETVALTVESFELSVDTFSESELFDLVNQERKKAGVGALVWEPEIVPVARAHAEDMWKRKYFSHVSPDGEDVGDRLNKNNIDYTVAGENLALAPTVQTAHTGLMNSEGHRKNILDPQFSKIGIGVVDNGYYGKMFVQVFSD